MGWSIGFDSEWNRDVGYGVPAICDHPGCNERIDRGLANVCGGEPFGGEVGCGLFFCGKHLWYHKKREHDGCQMCARCKNSKPPFKAKPDVPEWIAWKLNDESWAAWRAENPDFVKQNQPSPTPEPKP